MREREALTSWRMQKSGTNYNGEMKRASERHSQTGQQKIRYETREQRGKSESVALTIWRAQRVRKSRQQKRKRTSKVTHGLGSAEGEVSWDPKLKWTS
jgi:hypothetical protein